MWGIATLEGYLTTENLPQIPSDHCRHSIVSLVIMVVVVKKVILCKTHSVVCNHCYAIFRQMYILFRYGRYRYADSNRINIPSLIWQHTLNLWFWYFIHCLTNSLLKKKHHMDDRKLISYLSLSKLLIKIFTTCSACKENCLFLHWFSATSKYFNVT